MAWFLNRYRCESCGSTWTEKWSCMCDDDCPCCGARENSPFDSDDLTRVIKQRGDRYVVLWSPETAEHTPDYRELAAFPTLEQAEQHLAVTESAL